jgi:adenosylcobinamide-GDP ribazoletransferase
LLLFFHRAFHEDGFADVCDGFGGGWTKEKILMIMKDSAIGYGAIGLILLLLLKYQGLTQLIAVPENPTFIIYNSQFTILFYFCRPFYQ